MRRKQLRRTAGSDIEVIGAAIRAGVLALPKDQQQHATRNLSGEQKALLAHLCPAYKSVYKFLDGYQPSNELLKAARAAMKINYRHG